MSRRLLLSWVLLAAACKLEPEFVRSNPLDSKSDMYRITLTGPDSTHSANARVQLTMHVDPPLPDVDYRIDWEAGPWYGCVPVDSDGCIAGPIVLAVAGANGAFEVIDARGDYRPILLSVSFGERAYSHPIMIGQKVARLELSCSEWTLPYDPCDDVPRQRDELFMIHPRAHDPAGIPITKKLDRVLATRGTVVSRDSLIVMPMSLQLGLVQLHSRNPGTTWIVLQIDGVADSIRVVVAP